MPIASTATGPRGGWLFSPALDLFAFAGSAALAFLFLAIGHVTGALAENALGVGESERAGMTHEWMWIAGVLLVDVAHVWSTAFVVYVDRAELARRPRVYLGTPVAAWLGGVALYAAGDMVFWRALAYLAVFHFVRQQYGWVMLYRARAGERGSVGRWVDTLAIYAATVYPLVVWHARLPRRFAWFMPGDFAGFPAEFGEKFVGLARPLYVFALAAYAVRAVFGARTQGKGGRAHVGKHVVVLTTALTWYVGIVLFDSDYAFTVLNVFAHGIPYLVLVGWYAAQRGALGAPGLRPLVRRGPLAFGALVLGAVWFAAYTEELVWDRAIWHERAWLFGGSWDITATLRGVLVPLLAVPQITHYVVDGVLWKRSNPNLKSVWGSATA